MFRYWLAWVRREFERGVLGKGRPRVGTRRRERMPRAMAASGVGFRAARALRAAPAGPSAPAAPSPSAAPEVRDWPRLEWQPRERRSAQLPNALMFAAVIATIVLGVFVAAAWASQGERGLLSVGLGAAGRTPTAAATAQPTLAPTAEPTQAPLPTPRVYVVEQGDTLAMIAEEHGTSVEALLEANDDLDDPALLQVGQELVIPDPDGGRQ